MILEVKDVQASYEKLQVLRGVSLQVKKGDLVALIGPNGSGKSTTLKTIFGLLKPSSGSILFNGKSIAGMPAHEVVKLGISFVPQGRRVFSTMTVKENLEMGAYLVSDSKIVQERLKQAYELFPMLKAKQNHKATFLSGGEQQMLSIARSLMLDPQLLLLDEPSLGLAPKTMAEIFSKIKKINSLGTTVVLVEQNASMALQIANKVYVLENGRVAISGGPELANKKIVKDLYLGH